MLLALLLACDTEPTAPPEAPAPAAETMEAAAEEGEAEAEAESAPGDGPRVLATTTERLAASHVLVAWQGAMKADPSITRTREEAQARAAEVLARARAGEPFADLARSHSDDKTAKRGGRVGNFNRGTMVPAFEEAVLALQPGEFSEVVESPFGFHVIRRDVMSQIHCAQIVVGFAEAAKPVDGVSRPRSEAQTRVDAALAELAAGAPWEATVRKYSDGPAKDDNGDLGWFSRRQLLPQLDEAAFNLDIGGTTGVIESPAGFHVIKRLE